MTWVCLLISFIPQKTTTGLQDIMVIANKDVSRSEMPLKEITAIFKGEKIRWGNRTKIHIAIMKSSTSTGKFIASDILKMSPTAMDKHYLMLVFQGKITAPKTFTSDAELMSYVAETPGAIGIVSSQAEIKNVNKINITR